MSQHHHHHHRHSSSGMGVGFERLMFTIYSIVLVYLFYFSLEWKLEGNKIFSGWRSSYPSLYETLHPILFNKYNTIWFDSILIIIIFFFYNRHYDTLIRSSYTRGIYTLTSIIVWALLILTIFFWVGYLLSVPWVMVYWVA